MYVLFGWHAQQRGAHMVSLVYPQHAKCTIAQMAMIQTDMTVGKASTAAEPGCRLDWLYLSGNSCSLAAILRKAHAHELVHDVRVWLYTGLLLLSFTTHKQVGVHAV